MAKKSKITAGKLPLQTMLGVAVRAHRRQMGLTQQELAERADLHRTYLADIERGVRNVTLRSISNLAKALQMSVESLLFRSCGAGGLLAADPEAIGLGEVLLMSDNREDAETALRAFRLARLTNRVKVMRDGEAALQYVFCTGTYAHRSGGAPQLVLLDLDLPKISGMEVLRQMKDRESTRNIPVVILSRTRQEADLLEGQRLGAASHIFKPLEFENFARVTAKLDFQWALLPPGAAANLSS